uniref:Uncharacterized protein n=1 Tax=Arundo donax TaxID=35708 RepID=A0A0A9HUB1_ARUDO
MVSQLTTGWDCHCSRMLSNQWKKQS